MKETLTQRQCTNLKEIIENHMSYIQVDVIYGISLVIVEQIERMGQIRQSN